MTDLCHSSGCSSLAVDLHLPVNNIRVALPGTSVQILALDNEFRTYLHGF